ncbi:MAG: hypothetical protein AB7J13_13585 [Pyrinomonadaceae bacterium]
MSKEMLQPILVFVVGIIAVIVTVVSWFFVLGLIGIELYVYLVYAATYLFFGFIVGLFWRKKSIYGGIWLASPLAVLGIFGIFFSGLGASDMLILAIVILAGTVGCYLGQRLTSRHATEELN